MAWTTMGMWASGWMIATVNLFSVVKPKRTQSGDQENSVHTGGHVTKPDGWFCHQNLVLSPFFTHFVTKIRLLAGFVTRGDNPVF
jgi:hypothetical protein